MASASNRRGFLRLMLDEGVRGAQRTAGPLGVVVASAQPEPELATATDERTAQTVPARPTERVIGAGELDELIVRSGLGAQRDDVLALLRTSVRLTPAEHPAGRRSCFFAGATPPKGAGAPAWNGQPLHMLAQIDLSEVPASTALARALPDEGLLVLMRALDDVPSGLSTQHAGATSVAVLPDGRDGRRRRRDGLPAGARPLELSAELSLPRVWAAQVAELDLSEPEQAGWQLLRRELASLQGVGLFDESSGSGDALAMHRLSGHPDERSGQMRQICEAAALGIDLDEGPPYLHTRAREIESGEDRWELLFQLSADSELSWEWGDSRRRLYVWIDRQDLRAGDFSRVWGVVQ